LSADLTGIQGFLLKFALSQAGLGKKQEINQSILAQGLEALQPKMSAMVILRKLAALSDIQEKRKTAQSLVADGVLRKNGIKTGISPSLTQTVLRWTEGEFHPYDQKDLMAEKEKLLRETENDFYRSTQAALRPDLQN
jgi:hypothetical protein